MKKLYYSSLEEELEAARLIAENDISKDISESIDVNILNDDFGGDY